VVLIFVCCLVLLFVGVPRFQNSLKNEMAHALSTEVAVQVPDSQLGGGTYTISLAELQQKLTGSVNSNGVNGITLASRGQQLELSIETSGNNKVSYTGTPTVQNGRLVMADMQTSNSTLGFFMPADKLGNAIENGVNDFFSANNLKMTSLQVQGDKIIINATK
jgi:hypothetical protein